MAYDYCRNPDYPPKRTAPADDVASIPGKRSLTQSIGVAMSVPPVQRKACTATQGDVHTTAQAGVAGGGTRLPHLDLIQRSFGAYDVSKVQAHSGEAAQRASTAIGAQAYAMGNHVAFADTPDLHTAAHEAAHVVQQRGGVQLLGGVGEVGDAYERHADAVADLVVQGRSAEELLGECAGSARSSSDTPAMPAVQRIVRITPQQFLTGVGVNPSKATAAHVDEYIAIAIADELLHAIRLAENQDQDVARELRDSHGQLTGTALTPQKKLDALEKLIPALNEFLAANDRKSMGFSADTGELSTAPRPNSETRYKTKPDGVYQHSPLAEDSAIWGSDDRMHKEFAKGVGPGVATKTYSQDKLVGNGNLPVTQLSWEEAKHLLPRPLINLIFDVRYQLEPGPGNRVIDERTPEELKRRDKSPRAGGTLRSWHQDSKQVLPGVKGKVPEGSRDLDEHYAAHSTTGSGSSIGKGVDRPQGLAEYTGTGSDWEHNTKLVLDYVAKRVYLSLTHYGYWALVDKGDGAYTFWGSDSQERAQAEGKLKADTRDATNVIFMSPWIEILMPTGESLNHPKPSRGPSGDAKERDEKGRVDDEQGTRTDKTEKDDSDHLTRVDEKIDAQPLTHEHPSSSELEQAHKLVQPTSTRRQNRPRRTTAQRSTLAPQEAKKLVRQDGVSPALIALLVTAGIGLFVALLMLLR